MKRKSKLALTSITSLLNQVITVLSGFILPRYIIKFYGSSVNGLVSSITQFLNFISLAELGVGAVVKSSLYKPLAEHDDIEISKIVKSSEQFFRKIAILLVIYTAGLVILYPLLTKNDFEYIYTASLIVIISISTFAQYYIGMTYRLLLIADQLGFIYLGIHGLSFLVNIIISVVLMSFDAPIHLVKLFSSVIFAVQPILLSIIAKRKYKIIKDITLTEEPLEQKWNGLAQHVSSVVLGSTDTVILTLMSTLENVSIYNIYHNVVNGIKYIVSSLTNGIQSLMGNMLAKGEYDELERTFDTVEWTIHYFTTFVYLTTWILIIPFVKVYTHGITDSNYIQPIFSVVMVLAQAVYCIRLPYSILVLAAGHYKQTQWSAIFEALINIFITVFAVLKYGLIGVAVGTLVAMIYRTVYFVVYFSKNIINRSAKKFIRNLFVDSISIFIMIIIKQIGSNFFSLNIMKAKNWVLLATKTSLVVLFVVSMVNYIFYKNKMLQITKIISKKHK